MTYGHSRGLRGLFLVGCTATYGSRGFLWGQVFMAGVQQVIAAIGVGKGTIRESKAVRYHGNCGILGSLQF